MNVLATLRDNAFGTVTVNTGDTQDFDGDGTPNIIEFGFGTDASSTASGPFVLQYSGTFAGGGTITARGQPTTAFETVTNGVDFRAMFVRRSDYTTAGLIYTPQFSANLTTWQNSTAVPTILADDGTHQIVTVPYPTFIAGRKARFFRISITVAP